jgi:hypothetical protein
MRAGFAEKSFLVIAVYALHGPQRRRAPSKMVVATPSA